jgi:hypothetical protein
VFSDLRPCGRLVYEDVSQFAYRCALPLVVCTDTVYIRDMAKNWNPCSGVGKAVERGNYEVIGGAGSWATTRCPDCGRKVGASRPTKRIPRVTISMHHLVKKEAPVP